MKLKARVYHCLDLAAARGAFSHPHGDLLGLDAADIADGIAAEWDGHKRGRLIVTPGNSKHEASSLEKYVQAWLDSK